MLLGITRPLGLGTSRLGVSIILLSVTHDHEIKCFFFDMLEGPFSTLPV